jgi:hypothetical protein
MSLTFCFQLSSQGQKVQGEERQFRAFCVITHNRYHPAASKVNFSPEHNASKSHVSKLTEQKSIFQTSADCCKTTLENQQIGGNEISTQYQNIE